MEITKREFIQIASGGLIADRLTAMVDREAGLPHIPTRSTMPNILPIPDHHEPNNLFWGPVVDRLVIVPGVMWARFDSHEFKNGSVSMGYDPPHVPYGKNELKPVSVCEGFKQGGGPFTFLDPFAKNACKGRLSYADTNNPVPSELRAPESFAAFGISVVLDRDTSSVDVALFERNVVVRALVGSRAYLTCHAVLCTCRANMDGLVQRGHHPTASMPAKMYRADPPMIIPSKMTFRFLLDLTPGVGKDFGEFGGYVMFDGYHAQGVC